MGYFHHYNAKQGSLHAVGLWQATVGVVSGQQTILQVDHGLSDLLVPGQEIVVVDGDLQVLVLGQVACHLKHPEWEQSECLPHNALWI